MVDAVLFIRLQKKLNPWFRKRFMGSGTYASTFKLIYVTVLSDGFMYIISKSSTIEKNVYLWKKAIRVNAFYECHKIDEDLEKTRLTYMYMCACALCISASHIGKRYRKTKKRKYMKLSWKGLLLAFFEHCSLNHSSGTKKQQRHLHRGMWPCVMLCYVVVYVDDQHLSCSNIFVNYSPDPLTTSIYAYRGGT